MKFRFEKKLYFECSKNQLFNTDCLRKSRQLRYKKKGYKEKFKKNQFMKANFNNSNYNNWNTEKQDAPIYLTVNQI